MVWTYNLSAHWRCKHSAMAMPPSTVGSIRMADEEYTWLKAVGPTGKSKTKPSKPSTAPQVCQFYHGKVIGGRIVTHITQGTDHCPLYHTTDANGGSPEQLSKSHFELLLRPE